MHGRSARRRIGLTAGAFLATLAVVVAVIATAAAVAVAAARRSADGAARLGLEQAADLTAQLLAGRGRSLAGGARVFVQGPYFRALVVERGREDILDQAIEAATQLQADWVLVTDERGVLLAKSDEPGVAGDELGSIPLVGAAMRGGVATGFGASGDSLLFQAVAVPIVVPGSAPVGVLVAARVVDSALARDIRAATGADVAFYTRTRVDASFAGAASVPGPVARAAVATVARPARDDAASDAGAVGGAAATVRAAGVTYDAQRAAVATAGGEIVGGFVLLRARDATPPGLRDLGRALFAAAAIGLLLAAVVAGAAHRTVVAPVRALAAATRRAEAGDPAPVRGAAAFAAGARGELGALAAAVGDLLAELHERRRLAALVARADARGAVAAYAAARAALSAGAAEHAPPAPPAPASRIGPVPAPGDVVGDGFAIEAEVGAGGTGIVYRAVDLAAGERVALKVLRPELAADPQAAERLAHELRLARRVRHRNVVRAREPRAAGGRPVVVMEWVDGLSLDAVLRACGAIGESDALAVARQLARALVAAHEQGVAHGDLKPANLLLARDGTLKVADFGVAALVHRRTGAARDASGAPVVVQLAGGIVGTPEYMAPEVLLGAAPDVRADLYSAGVVLHECLAGPTEHAPETPREFLARKLDATPAPPPRWRSTEPPRTLLAIAGWLTAADRDARPASATVLLAALDRLR